MDKRKTSLTTLALSFTLTAQCRDGGQRIRSLSSTRSQRRLTACMVSPLLRLAAAAYGLYRFRWVYCQLDALRRYLPANIQHALNRLPETLDETYERTLLDIPEEKWEHAHRLFQCLIACNRPLRVKELAEVLAIKFDAEGTANLQTEWRLEEAEEAVLSTCSTLIMVVDNDDYNYDYNYDYNHDYNHDDIGSRIVQFSHFSVKEFLTSSRLTGSRQNISRYHVLLGPSHMILTQACLSALLRLDDSTDGENILNFPLAMYAANHWHIHALQENVKPRIQGDDKRLFDLSEPHYAAWTWIYNASFGISRQRMSIFRGRPPQPAAPPLFYAARFDLRDLVVDLVARRPQDINATHIDEGSPLLSALLSGHLEIAELLIEHGAHASIADDTGYTPLSEISAKGYLELVNLLLKHGAETEDRWTEASYGAFVAALRNGQFDFARFLLHHNVGINAQDRRGETPLHQLLTGQLGARLEGVQWLLEHGADVNARDNNDQTPLSVASRLMTRPLPQLGADVKAQDQDTLEIIRLLLYRGADARAKNKIGDTPLHEVALSREGMKVVKLLVEHGADVNAKAYDLQTPLHLASRCGSLEIVRFLIEHGADISAVTKRRSTILHMASESENLEVVRFFVERGADVNAKTEDLRTPLHRGASVYEVVRFLVEHGADTSAETEEGETPLHMASRWGIIEVARFLLERGANIDAKTKERKTPLHVAMEWGNLGIIRFLVDRGADVNAKAEDLQSPLHLASERGSLDVARFLVDSGAVMNAETVEGETPLHVASKNYNNKVARKVVQFLVERGVDVNAKTKDLRTPLHLASQHGCLGAVEFLVEHGADISAQTKSRETPLHVAAKCGDIRVVRFLVGRGADVNSRTDDLRSPLHLVSEAVSPAVVS